MATYSDKLRLVKQETGENVDTWGDVFNAQALELIEDALTDIQSINVGSGNVTLSTNNGSSDQARAMMLKATGAPGAARTITVPTLSKVYFVWNACGQDLTVKTSSGTGVTIADDERRTVFCDGTNVEYGTDRVENADNADLAADASKLGDVAASNYARKDVNQSFSKGQTVTENNLGSVTGTVTPNAANSNVFRMVLGGSITLANPSNLSSGQTLLFIINQGATGGDSVSFGSKYVFPEGVEKTMSNGNNDVDMVSCVYSGSEDKLFCTVMKNFT